MPMSDTASELTVAIRRLPGHEQMDLPEYQSELAAGMDLHAAIDEKTTLQPGEITLVPCGIAIALPAGFEAQVRPRSGLAVRHGVTVVNAPGTIDADYRGEIKVGLINHGREPVDIDPAMRIAQLVVAPVTRVQWQPVEDLPATARGAGGFGHTGH